MNSFSDIFKGFINGIRIASTAITLGLIGSAFFIPPIAMLAMLPTFLSYSLVCAATTMWCKSYEKEKNFQKVLNKIAMLKEMGYSIEIEFENQEMVDYYYDNPQELEKIVMQLVEIANMPEDDVDVQIGIDEDGEMQFMFKDEKATESLIQMVIQRAREMAEQQGIELSDEDIMNAINNVQDLSDETETTEDELNSDDDNLDDQNKDENNLNK